jgi:hypothetical protein
MIAASQATEPTETGPNTNYRRLRLLFGLPVPAPVGAQQILDDQVVIETQQLIRNLPVAQQPAEYLQAFRYFAALDEADLAPPTAADGTQLLFPGGENDALVLANVFAVKLNQQTDGSWVVDGTAPPVVDNSPRLALLPTWTIEELLGSGDGGGLLSSPVDAGGPRVASGPVFDDSVAGQTGIKLTLTAPLASGTVTVDAFSVTTRDLSLAMPNTSPWHVETITQATFVNGTQTPTVTLTITPALSSNRPLQVRVVAKGTGPAPLLGSAASTNNPNIPFAGTVGGPPGSLYDGHDYVVMVRR